MQLSAGPRAPGPGARSRRSLSRKSTVRYVQCIIRPRQGWIFGMQAKIQCSTGTAMALQKSRYPKSQSRSSLTLLLGLEPVSETESYEINAVALVR